MRALLQRVSRARVSVQGREISSIPRGLVIFLGVHKNDTPAQVDALIKKIIGLRIFDDAEGKMNLPLESVGGEYLVVSQFTLYGDLSRGKRPGFDDTMRPPGSLELYRRFCERLESESGRPVKRGEFGSMMDVELTNQGPATFLLEAMTDTP